MAGKKKVVTIVGGIILGVSLISILLGFVKFSDGQEFNPPSDSFWGGSSSDSPGTLSDFSVTGDLLYMIWTEDNANSPNVSITNNEGEEIFTPCTDDGCSVKEGFRELGTFGIPTNDTRSYTITISGEGNAYVMTPLEGAGNTLLGIIIMAGGGCFSICGIVILISGLAMKVEDSLATTMVQQVAEGQMEAEHMEHGQQ